jgi:hypothetical protein
MPIGQARRESRYPPGRTTLLAFRLGGWSSVTIPAGYAADEYRLIGKISGPGAFSGTLLDPGWKTDSVNLPRLVRTGPDRLPTSSPKPPACFSVSAKTSLGLPTQSALRPRRWPQRASASRRSAGSSLYEQDGSGRPYRPARGGCGVLTHHSPPPPCGGGAQSAQLV